MLSLCLVTFLDTTSLPTEGAFFYLKFATHCLGNFNTLQLTNQWQSTTPVLGMTFNLPLCTHLLSQLGLPRPQHSTLTPEGHIAHFHPYSPEYSAVT